MEPNTEADVEELLASLPDTPDLSKEIAEVAKITQPIPPAPPKPIQPVQEPVLEKDVIKIASSDLLVPGGEATNLTAPFLELLKTFPTIANKIIANHASDREQVEQAIKFLETQMKNMGNKLPAVILETWAKLLATKAEINANANGVLDSSAKLLAAAKNNNIIINVGDDNKSIGGLDLAALLAQPQRDDEALTRKK
jgi:hypothetical protein